MIERPISSLGPTLETERLFLRPPTLEDFPRWADFMSDPETTRFIGGVQSKHEVWRAMASVAGRLGYAFRTPYAATQWAVIGLMKSLAIELGPHGVRVNAILPGTVEGERINGVIAARAAATGTTPEAMREDYLRKTSLRRMVTADDLAAMALFLCSPAARNVSGQAIGVDANTEYL